MAKQSSAADSKQPVAEAGDKAARGLLGSAFDLMAKAVNAVMADGTLAAAGRQGIDELGAALKAFPDAIQVAETGSIWNPTQGEVAKAREKPGERLPWPSEIAAQNREKAGTVHGHDHGHDAGHENEASM